MNFPYRQIHLDFHTAGDIPDVGARFDAAEFKRILTDAAVDSITLFSVCHHGYSYHPTKVGKMHPGLKFDLLGAQIKAAKEAGIRTQIYISAGGNERLAVEHPEWREVNPPGVWHWSSPSPLDPGFNKLCFNTAYMDHLCALTEEAVLRYPDAAGVFFDIILQNQCCCPKCIRDMYQRGLDPHVESDRISFSREVLHAYFQRITDLVRRVRPDMKINHNAGNPMLRDPELMQYYSHLELESLPTGGWGYDHFPLSAGAARRSGLPFAGMTGKFHGSWGEFGGIKHPNALRYECAAMLAAGARCNIGDQLHPCGMPDATTYRVIGEAFREVREKEPYCVHAVNRAEIAVISAEACGLNGDSDIGLSRALLESHFLFDVIRPDMDLSPYRLLIFPEGFSVDPVLKAKLSAYFSTGGKALFCGECIRDLPFDVPAEIGAVNSFSPTYVLPAPEVCPDFVTTPFVVYGSNVRIVPHGAKSLGEVYEPFYNRTLEHFCSHAQTPNRLTPSGDSMGIVSGQIALLAHPLFSIYRSNGAAVLRRFLEKTVDLLLYGARIVSSDLPSVARCTVTTDEQAHRDIVHLLYAPMVKRGNNTELIEDLIPLVNIRLSVRTEHPVKAVRIVPDGKTLDFTVSGGRVCFTVEQFTCHAMIALEW